jgi:predicted ATPase/DNA-binding SARP family transcriptional activator
MTQPPTVSVLGPVEVQAPDRAPVTLPPSVRSLLARLALSPGRLLPADTLTDALWGEGLPVDAANALQTRVSKLRRALAAAGVGDVVRTQAPGYLLDVLPDAVDAFRFEQLATAARAAGQPRDAALGILDEALGLWRGPALADVGDLEWVTAEAARLEELRLGVVEDRLELLLDAGRTVEAVADLERLVPQHPLRERPHRLMMLALYRAGRQADALTVYHGLRSRLADELGIDPAPDVRALAEAILRQQVPDAPPARAAASLVPPEGTGPARPRAAVSQPRRLTEMIGRDQDAATLLDLLEHERLVTITGPGGVGKTTLALDIARRTEGRLVRLAPVAAGADIAEPVARELGILPEGPGELALSAIVAALSGGRTLLVVDNCEHVVDQAAHFVEDLLTSCPGVQVLATSREALAVPGEVQVALHPLDPDAATQLFARRAGAVRSGFSLDDRTSRLVRLICDRVDRLPLALELAAARTKALPLEEIADRLGDRFTLLSSGPRTAEARHRMLRATLDWSHDLLTDDEQAVLRRLSVFRGGFTLAAAEYICGTEPVTAEGVVDIVFRLVDRSLVVPDPATGRFRLLVTIRDYGAEQLGLADEDTTTRTRHLEYFTRLAEENTPVSAAGGTGWLRLRDYHPNLRTALDAAVARAQATGDPADVEAGLRLATALVWFWQYDARYEGVAALTTLLDLAGGSERRRAAALQGLAMLHIYYPTQQSRAAARESLDLFERIGDARGAATSRLVIAWEGQYTGDVEQARRLVAEAEPVLAASGPAGMRALFHYVRALLDLREKAFDASLAEWERSRQQLLAADDHVLESAVRAHAGLVLRAMGRHSEAIRALEEAVDLVSDGKTLHGLAFALVHLAHARLDHDEETSGADVTDLLERAEDAARRARNPRCTALAAWGRARIALAAGDVGTAVREGCRAVELLGDREFPWVLQDLHSFVRKAQEAPGP